MTAMTRKIQALRLRNLADVSAPGAARVISDWIARSRSRSALARLDERLLADIGLDTARACREAGQPFWK